MTTESTTFLTNLYNRFEEYFSLEDIRALCFDLGFDYDSIPGEGKSAKIRELILQMGRTRKMHELVNYAQENRSHVTWPAVPPDFRLPHSGEWSTTSQPTHTVVQGDLIHGDKVGGDKVGGDKITIGDISNSQGVAVGRGAQAEVSIRHGISGEQLDALFVPLLQVIARQTATQTEALAKVNLLKTEAGKGQDANDEAMAGLVEDIVNLVPAAVETIINLFTNSIIAKSAGAATKYVLKRIHK